MGPFLKCLQIIVSEANQFREDADPIKDLTLYRPLCVAKSTMKAMQSAIAESGDAVLIGMNIDAPLIHLDGIVSALPSQQIAEGYTISAICQMEKQKAELNVAKPDQENEPDSTILDRVERLQDQKIMPVLLKIEHSSSYNIF